MRIRDSMITAVCVCLNSSLWGQQVLVQQPRVQTFGVDTTVSVPDRGGILLGGVSQAASGWQTYGPIPWGTSRGQSLSNSSSWSHVWIHDLQAMDEAVLAEAAARRAQVETRDFPKQVGSALSLPVVRQAERAAQQLLNRSNPTR